MDNLFLSTAELDEQGAKEICSLRYAPPYDVYNYPDWYVVSARHWAIADPEKRKAQLYAVKSGEKLIGYFRLSEEPDCINLGLGLAPECCGKGFGKPFMELVLQNFKNRNTKKPFRLEVRNFNERARKCYERAGFTEIGRCRKDTPIGASDFIIMEYRQRMSTVKI